MNVEREAAKSTCLRVVDSDGTWIQPNLILALVYDYLVLGEAVAGWVFAALRLVGLKELLRSNHSVFLLDNLDADVHLGWLCSPLYLGQ